MHRPPPARLIIPIIVGGMILVFFMVKGCSAYRALQNRSTDAREKHQQNGSKPPSVAAPTIGMKILKDYASPDRSPQDDLADMAHALTNFALLVKGDTPIPLGANEEVANALKGKNKARLRFLPDDAPCFNAQGQLIDRWGVALFFHATDKDRIDIRSAGPDKTMWTPDDLHRTHDGRFLSGPALNAPSLLDATTRKPSPK